MSEREAWELDVTAALERRIFRSGARPDFLDVVARAHAIDPAVVTAEALAEADVLVDAVSNAEPEPERGAAPIETALDGWLHDVRSAVDRRVDARREQELPALRVPTPRRGVWWLVGAAVAAAALLVLGVGQVVRMVADPIETPEQALHMNDGAGSSGVVEEARPRPTETTRGPRTRALVEPEVVEPEPEVVEPEPEVVEPEPVAPQLGARGAGTKSDRERERERLKALADEAQAHWRAGRREQAQRSFAAIVAAAGRSSAAELAYADLFTLASQADDPAAQRRWWKDYLRRFPRGRFADDARAGLCRGAASTQRAACWQAYLDDFPGGSFRGEAQAALGQGAR